MGKNKDQKCIVYIESLEELTFENRINVYIDFRTEHDLSIFNDELNDNFGENNSIIVLKSIQSSRRLIAGAYYALNLRLIKSMKYDEVEDSYLIGRIYNFSDMNTLGSNNAILLSHHTHLNHDDLLIKDTSDEWPTLSLSSNLRLKVRDVGQANWNELLEDDHIRLIYDLGAELHAHKIIVEKIYNVEKTSIERDRPLLVLSHWDMDHIHCLRYLSIQDIRTAFQGCVCVNQMKSITSKRVYTKLETALGKKNIICLEPHQHKDDNLLIPIHDDGHISYYIGKKSSNINFGGVCVFVRGDNKSVALTGDVRLTQAKSMVDIEFITKCPKPFPKEHILVAPHHGGDYGTKYRQYFPWTTEVLISVGTKNSYGHPKPTMMSYLSSLCANNIKRTDIHATINVQL